MSSIEYFFVSKVRIKLLQLFFFNPQDEYHVRGVVRLVEEEINAVRRELVRMEKAKMLKSERKGNRLYFALREEFVFYNEFRSLLHKEFGLGKAIIRNKNKLGDLKFALLTSIFVRKMRLPHDEVDLVVVGNVNLDVLNEVVKSQQEFVGREINYTVMSEEEFNLRRRRSDTFVSGLLKDTNVMLVGVEDNIIK